MNRGPSLYNLALVAVALVLISLLLGGCSRAGDTQKPGGTSTSPRDVIVGAGMPVAVDQETGCQYLGYDSHGLTPRMEYVRGDSLNGGRGSVEYVHKGCRIRNGRME